MDLGTCQCGRFRNEEWRAYIVCPYCGRSVSAELRDALTNEVDRDIYLRRRASKYLVVTMLASWAVFSTLFLFLFLAHSSLAGDPARFPVILLGYTLGTLGAPLLVVGRLRRMAQSKTDAKYPPKPIPEA